MASNNRGNKVGELYMERQAKIDLVIKEIEKTKQITPKGQEVKVYLPTVLKSKQIRVEELYNVLSKLEDDEKVITLMHFPTGLLNLRDGWGNIYPPEEFDLSQEYFTLRVRRNFDEWCADYWNLAGEGNKTKSTFYKIWEEFKDFMARVLAYFAAEKTK